jgi:hypothetical protein
MWSCLCYTPFYYVFFKSILCSQQHLLMLGIYVVYHSVLKLQLGRILYSRKELHSTATKWIRHADCNQEEETVTHFLITCNALQNERRALSEDITYRCRKFKAFVIRHTVIDLICPIFLYFLTCHSFPCRFTERSTYIFITVLNVILKAKLFYFNEPTVTLVCFYVKINNSVSNYKSLEFLTEGINIGKVHHMLTTTSAIARDICCLPSRIKIATGTYILQSKRAAFNSYKVDLLYLY